MDISEKTTVKKMELREKDLRKQELNDIRTVLSNSSGRRLLWRLLENCKTFNTIFSEDTSRLYYRAGKQDIGHFLMAEIAEADTNLLFKLMKENKEGKK